MMTSKEVAVETDLAVRRVLARYCHLVDDGDFDPAADMFTEDGRFNALGTDLQGRPAIREWLGTVPSPMFHHVTNVVVSNGSHGKVHAVSDCMVGGKRDDGPWTIWMLGRYHDTLVGEGRDMRFSQRIFTAR
jgi:3-phenylpropionate/cinnamic acid dioxygenase small subunit